MKIPLKGMVTYLKLSEVNNFFLALKDISKEYKNHWKDLSQIF